jgi:hypothetical protein
VWRLLKIHIKRVSFLLNHLIMKKVILFSFVALAMTSCAITLPVAATSNSVKDADKTGISKATMLFGVLPLGGDASVISAARNGGIDKIATVDMTTTNFLNILVTYETKVTGHK